MLGLPVLEGTNAASCFPRSVIGYEAACYSRIWSEVWILLLLQLIVQLIDALERFLILNSVISVIIIILLVVYLFEHDIFRLLNRLDIEERS